MIFSLPRLSGAVEDATSKAKQVRRLTVEWCGFFPTGTFNQQKGSLKRVVFIPKLGGFKYFFFIFTPPRIVCGKMIPFLTKIAHIFQNGLVKNYQLEKERKESPQASFFRGKLAKT